MHFSRIILAATLACTTLAAPTASIPSLKDILSLVTPQVEQALHNEAFPVEAKDKLHDILDQVQGLIPLLPAVPLTKRTTLPQSFSLKDIFSSVQPQVEKALDNDAIPAQAKEKLNEIVNQVQDLIPLLPTPPVTKRGEDLTKRQTKSRLKKPADYNDPNFARVVLDDIVNEMYRIHKVDEFKKKYPTMQLTPEIYNEVTAEISLLAISAPEATYCAKVKSEVHDFEFTVAPEDLQKLCTEQRNFLIARHEEAEALFAKKEEMVKKGDLVGAKALKHRLDDIKAKEMEHRLHGQIERARWIKKQKVRAKFEEDVKNGLREDVYDRGN
jgi:hypothetical protein